LTLLSHLNKLALLNNEWDRKMEYKGYKIVQMPIGYSIIDSKFNQEIKCKSIQACKIRISKLIQTRIKFGI
jgi:aryl-phospho-beta-D-glucosidase BglC (GH1 family)